MTLTATTSLEVASRARNTVPMPPLPTDRSISNLPPSNFPGVMKSSRRSAAGGGLRWHDPRWSIIRECEHVLGDDVELDPRSRRGLVRARERPHLQPHFQCHGMQRLGPTRDG
jgi:hypothetical protein